MAKVFGEQICRQKLMKALCSLVNIKSLFTTSNTNQPDLTTQKMIFIFYLPQNFVTKTKHYIKL